jgi:TatA/E family protein of Tat protein translocase
MPTVLLFLEFLGTTELMVIALVALVIFGPRKLPEIGRSLGRSLAEFKRASDDFKRTWEYEVEMEQRQPTLPTGPETDGARARLPDHVAGAVPAATGATAEEFAGHAARVPTDGQTIARHASGPSGDVATHHASEAEATEGVEASESSEPEGQGQLNPS